MATQPFSMVPGVFWVGAFNPSLRVFDIIMRTEQGTTYNAYLVRGARKTALIETVKRGFSNEMFERLQAILPLEQIDYLVANHLEPDHSGSILECLARMPNARVVVAKNGIPFLKELTNQDLNPLAVGTGDTLDLGGKTLEFITAPFLHWPDTMFTYLREDQVLFSCDFLGCHFCHTGLWASRATDFSHAYQYYYNHIMRPFKEHVLKGLEAVQNLPLRMIAPSHGPILDQDLAAYMEKYRVWSSQPEPVAQGSALIFYVSAYGLTGQLAAVLAEGVQSQGVRAAVYDLAGTEIPDVLSLIEAADGLALGSCTINGDAVEPVWGLLSSLATLKIKGKWAVAFGSYGWSGEAVPMIEERVKSLKFKLAAPGLRVKFTPRPEDLEAAKELGKTLALKIKETRTR